MVVVVVVVMVVIVVVVVVMVVTTHYSLPLLPCLWQCLAAMCLAARIAMMRVAVRLLPKKTVLEYGGIRRGGGRGNRHRRGSIALRLISWQGGRWRCFVFRLHRGRGWWYRVRTSLGRGREVFAFGCARWCTVGARGFRDL
jgi:hypothetical protein